MMLTLVSLIGTRHCQPNRSLHDARRLKIPLRPDNPFNGASNAGGNIAVNPAKCPKRSIIQNASHLVVAPHDFGLQQSYVSFAE
jgi:hypothetical protein